MPNHPEGYLPHHVVLKNGRDDIVCACGEHFRKDAANAFDMVPARSRLDAIQKWAIHYKEEELKEGG